MAEDYGIKISLPGKNVIDAEDNELLFNSAYPALKIHSQGSGTFTLTGYQTRGFNAVLTTHNLGYRPMFMVWFDVNDEGYRLVPFQRFEGTFWLSYFATSKGENAILDPNTLAVGMDGLSTNREDLGEPAIPPADPSVINYSWIIFYDPTNE